MTSSPQKTTELALRCGNRTVAEHLSADRANGHRVTRLYPRWRGGCCPCFHQLAIGLADSRVAEIQSPSPSASSI
eukprot:scaffold58255_cov25-Phaeocystis_antarctica.AAC.1